MSRHTKILILTFFATTMLVANGQDYVLNPAFAKKAPLYFVVNKDNTELFASAHGTSSSKKLGLGSLFFVRKAPGNPMEPKEENSRFEVGVVDKWGDYEPRGWVGKENLLRGVRPVTVGKLVEDGLLQATGNGSEAFSKENVLPLKVVSKPEREMKLSKDLVTPGQTQAVKFSWFHVFDVANGPDGSPHYLIGRSPMLKAVEAEINQPEHGGLEADTEASDSLLGWVPKENVQEWPSNLVLEYNAELASLESRYAPDQQGSSSQASASPALLFEEPDSGSRPKATEPLDAYWGDFFKQMSQNTPGDSTWYSAFSGNGPYPIGLKPEFARFHIIDRQEASGWVRVATLGSASGISAGEVVEIQKKIAEAYQELRKVDIVFVVDATGSMGEEIAGVRQFLISLSNGFAAGRKGTGKEATTQEFEIMLNDQKVRFPTTLDIRVSLVSYQDVGGSNSSIPYETRVHFSGTRITSDAANINAAFDDLSEANLDGGTEAIHAGLAAALQQTSLANLDSMARFILVVADEEGDSGDLEQTNVLDLMPLPEGVDLASDVAKQNYTQVFGLFTDPDTSRFNSFSNNLRMVTNVGQNVVHASQFTTGGGSGQLELLEDLIWEKISEVPEVIKKRLDLLAQTLSSGSTQPTNAGGGSINTRTASVLMNEWAVEQALQAAGIDRATLTNISNDLAFIEGWVREEDYSRSVLMQKGEIVKLSDGLSRFAASLERFINIGQGDPPAVVMRALAESTYALATGGGELEESRLEAEVDRIEQELSQPGSTVGSVLGIINSLPADPNGILGMNLEKINQLTVPGLATIIKTFRRKVSCIDWIQQNRAIPADLTEVDRWTKEKQFRRTWEFTPPQSVVPYIYLPEALIP